jgi:hypothetical protein
MAANRYTIRPQDTTDNTMLVILEPRKKPRVRFAQREEAEYRRRIDDVVHILTRNQILMSRATVMRFSALRRSGVKPGTIEPDAPWLPPAGVIPPAPAK